eukprot:2742748-Ditylum_brightwellii.AAC.1
MFFQSTDISILTDLANSHLIPHPSPVGYARKVPTASLHHSHIPSSFANNSTLLTHDATVWKSAYAKEYFGLHTDKDLGMPF